MATKLFHPSDPLNKLTHAQCSQKSSFIIVCAQSPEKKIYGWELNQGLQT